MLDYEFLFIISLPLYICFLIVLIFKKREVRKIIRSSFFYFYMVALIAVTFFPIPIQWWDEIWKYVWDTTSLLPLSSLFNIAFNNNLDITIKIKQIIGNIILFIPMWFFIPLIWKNKNSLTKTFPIGIFASFSIEWLQYLISFFLGFHYKVTDVDDILLNIFGFIIGFYVYKVLKINLKKLNFAKFTKRL